MGNNLDNQLLDSVSDGVFTVDAEWRITSFNRTAERITGIKRAEAVGQRCCEVFRASICETACALKQTLATHRSIANKLVSIVNAQGERIPISISTAPLGSVYCKELRAAKVYPCETCVAQAAELLATEP